MDWFLARRWLPPLAGVLLGVGVGVAVSLLASSSRRAEASVLISSPRGPSAVRPLLPNLRELATGGVVAGNVRSTLRLKESAEQIRDRLHAEVRPKSEVIAIAATHTEADTARQLAQEAALVFSQLVDKRFASATPSLHAVVFDSAHVLSGPDRHWLRNVLVGGLAGLLLGAVAFFLLAGGVPIPEARALGATNASARDLRKREGLLDGRVQAVTKRERALAQQAGKLAARERELEDRAAKVAATPPPPTEPEPKPEPVAPAAEPPPVGEAGSWNVSQLQRLVDAQADSSPERSEEWRTYLFFLREHASAEGTLPPQFNGLVQDVFGDLL